MLDYRPISILNSLSNERAISDRLTELLENNRILRNSQFGFRKHLSPQIAVGQLVNSIVLTDLANKKYIIGFFLDLRKAFDTLDHGILLNKLHYYQIRNNLFNLIKCYLINRNTANCG